VDGQPNLKVTEIPNEDAGLSIRFYRGNAPPEKHMMFFDFVDPSGSPVDMPQG
jgi:hypothetical protein